MSSSSSSHGSSVERPRFFDKMMKSMCWANAATVPGRHPERWRKDAAGNIVCKRFCNCQGCLCFEYDHIVPFSKGGESTVENCQILQTRVNRFKSNKDKLGANQLKDYSCDIDFTDKELDIIEMAVYGDVIRPGNQCRCRTVAEMLERSVSTCKQWHCICLEKEGNIPIIWAMIRESMIPELLTLNNFHHRRKEFNFLILFSNCEYCNFGGAKERMNCFG